MEIIGIAKDGIEFRIEFKDTLPSCILLDAANLKCCNVHCDAQENSITINATTGVMVEMFSFEHILNNMLARTLYDAFKDELRKIIGPTDEALETIIPSETYKTGGNIYMSKSEKFIKFDIINTPIEILSVIMTAIKSDIDSSVSMHVFKKGQNALCVTTSHDAIHKCVEALEEAKHLDGAKVLSEKIILEVFYHLKFANWRKK